MQNMTLSVKISFGFAVLLLIAALLGSMAVINMMSVEKDSTKLANIYVPEVEVGNNIERWSMLTMYDIRGYSLSANKHFLDSGRENLKNVKKYLDDAQALARKYSLPALTKLEAKARENLAKYEGLVNRTEELEHKLDIARDEMDKGAGAFMKNANDFLANQNENLNKEIKARASSVAFNERHAKITWINDIIDLGNDTRVRNFKAQALREPEIMKSAFENFKKMDDVLEKIEKLTRMEEDKKRLANIHHAADTYENAMKTFMFAWTEMGQVNKQRGGAGDDVLAAAQETARVAMEHTLRISREASDNLGTASTTMIIGLIVALIIGIALALYLIRSITKPIINAVQNIAEGTSQVVSASDQIASSATALAEGATQQASSVEEVSATVEESTAINNQNAENAREADGLAKGANEAAATGNHKIQDLMKSMEQITEASQRIAKIIKTIDEIAFQTNLLALNAAVEAARAGEHGLGFAVVADEVKNLAGRSANAAKETADIIEEAIDMIKNGNQIAQDTNEAFGNILDKVKKTSDLISEIAVSAKEQSEGMNQIASAMSTVDQVTQQNAANSEEAAAASEEMNAQAVSMMGSVQDVATMVGLDIQADTSSHAFQSKATVKPAMISHRVPGAPKKKAAKQPPKQQASKQDEDVFPLDEDDLKEF